VLVEREPEPCTVPPSFSHRGWVSVRLERRRDGRQGANPDGDASRIVAPERHVRPACITEEEVIMDGPPANLEERYAAIVEILRDDAGVTVGSPPGKGFGASALKINDKIFAMLIQGRFVIKLPRQRVDTLVASGDGKRFESGQGRPMKEWVAIEPASELEWLALAKEARTFVASQEPASPRKSEQGDNGG